MEPGRRHERCFAVRHGRARRHGSARRQLQSRVALAARACPLRHHGRQQRLVHDAVLLQGERWLRRSVGAGHAQRRRSHRRRRPRRRRWAGWNGRQRRGRECARRRRRSERCRWGRRFHDGRGRRQHDECGHRWIDDGRGRVFVEHVHRGHDVGHHEHGQLVHGAIDRAAADGRIRLLVQTDGRRATRSIGGAGGDARRGAGSPRAHPTSQPTR